MAVSDCWLYVYRLYCGIEIALTGLQVQYLISTISVRVESVVIMVICLDYHHRNFYPTSIVIFCFLLYVPERSCSCCLVWGVTLTLQGTAGQTYRSQLNIPRPINPSEGLRRSITWPTDLFLTWPDPVKPGHLPCRCLVESLRRPRNWWRISRILSTTWPSWETERTRRLPR